MKRLLGNVAVVALCLTILTLLLMAQPTTTSAAAPRPVIPPLPVMGAGNGNINAAAGNNGNQGGNNGNQGGNNGNAGANGNAGNNGANGAAGGAGGGAPATFTPAAGSFFVIYPQPVQSGQATSLGSYPVGLVPVQMAIGMQGNQNNNNNLGVLIALGLINNAIVNQQLLLGGVGGKLGIGGLNGMYGGY